MFSTKTGKNSKNLNNENNVIKINMLNGEGNVRDISLMRTTVKAFDV